MPCLICGDPKTVRSHLVPKAIARVIRGDHPNHSVLQLNAERPQSLQAGRFDDELLCSHHEAVTGELDRYGVEFIRRVALARNDAGASSFYVCNPEPEKLARFAQSILWRAAVSPLGNVEKTELGPRHFVLTDSIFGNGKAFPLTVGTVALLHEGREMDIAVMPERIREGGLLVWGFQLLGCAFMLYIGNQAFPRMLDPARADRETRLYIANLGDQSALGWDRMREIITSIKRHPRLANDRICSP